MNWRNFLSRLSAYPAEFHRILPPCPEEGIEAVQRELGPMPQVLIDMLRHFNGAELFCPSNPVVTIFGISTIPAPPAFDGAHDWYIDKYTPGGRSALHRPNDWVIAMTNYGGVIFLNQDGWVDEWDSSQGAWDPVTLPLDAWIEKQVHDGDVCLKEMSE